jgi:hypothetical protein
LRNPVAKRLLMCDLLLVFTVCMVLPGIAMAAGDDCPTPGDGGSDDYYMPGEDDGSEEEQDKAPPKEETADDEGGLMGSLGSMSGQQLTIGILAVVGVSLGAVYFIMVTRMDEYLEEYDEGHGE